MSEHAVLWLLGFMILALGALVAALAKIFWAKLNSIDSGALSAFIARFNATEKGWEKWRDDLERDRDVRHKEARTEIESLTSSSRDHERRITRIERNGHS